MQRDEALQRIAHRDLEFSTLETRNSDSLDFKELAVWDIKKALEAAYAEGRTAGLEEAAKGPALGGVGWFGPGWNGQ